MRNPRSIAPAIRPADLSLPADAEVVLMLLDAYASDRMGGGQPLSGAVRRRLVPALREVPGHLVLLAADAERSVGLAVCFEAFSTFQARPLLNIHDLAVLPGYRGRGIGRALIAAVEAQAVLRGCCKLTLEVRDDNLLADGLYRGLGFGAGRDKSGPVQYRFLEKRLESCHDVAVGRCDVVMADE